MEVHGRLVQQGVVLSYELASDDVGTRCFLHYHYSYWTENMFYVHSKCMGMGGFKNWCLARNVQDSCFVLSSSLEGN